jgi:peptide/nickel transport system substrate-binding protein
MPTASPIRVACKRSSSCIPAVATSLAAALVLAAVPSNTAAAPRVFRYAAQGDVLDLDPHGVNEGQTTALRILVYEGLVRRSSELKLEPALAVSWSQPAPTRWRFQLRPGVKFHDGSPFTADDVVFSFQRATHRNSDMRSYVSGVREVVKVDALTVDYVTEAPDPILLNKLAYHFILSRAWAEKNGAAEPSPRSAGEAPMARRANGTGPFRLVERVPDTRIVFEANPEWWEKPSRTHNLDRVEYRPIANAATRVAALLSGEVDLVLALPPQDEARVRATPGFRVLETPDLRTIYLGFDHRRDELLDVPGTGRNPFKDGRVRRAVLQAIDVEAIHRKTMRGASRPNALLAAPAVQGYDKALDVRLPLDPAASRRLLAEAGYPQGFEVTLDCTNDRYVNDEAICQAIVPMLARVGIRVSLNSQTKNVIFEKIRSYRTSFYLMGWTPTTLDTHYTLANLAVEQPPEPSWNCGRYAPPQVAELTRAIAVEMDPAKRNAMIVQALRFIRDDVGYVPLHDQTVAWAVRDGVDVKVAPDNIVRPFLVTLR